MALVEVRGLTVSFGAVTAVSGIDLNVAAGNGVALVGRNGAGKSTTLRVLAGAAVASAGQIRICGIDTAVDPEGAKARLGYCPDVGGLIPRATAWEHLQLSASLRGLGPDWHERGRELLDRFDLTAAADRITAGFSHGMSRRLSVVIAALAEPDVLLLDEPFDGVDPLGVDATLEEISRARARGAAVLVSTHLIELAVSACDEAVVLRRGQIVAAAPAIELRGESGAEFYRSLLG